MPNITYPYAVKYKGRYYMAGEEIITGGEKTAGEPANDNAEAEKPVKRRTAKKKAEAEST